MEFVSQIIGPIVESLLVPPIKKHLGFLVSYTKNAKDTDARMEQLNEIAKDMQTKKDAADAKSHEVPHGVARWLNDVKKMDEKAKSIPTGDIGCFNVAKRYKAGKQSFNILKEIDDLKTRESEIKWTNEQKSLAKVASTSTSAPVVGAGTQTGFGSRDLIFKKALKSLDPNNETQKMIALCGMGGVGKTTMMEQLKKAVEDSKMFYRVVKVVLGEDTNSIALQQAIAECITGKDLTETTKDARADRLREKFKDMSEDGKKKILVIMDDLWKEVDLNDVGLRPLPNGFKLLFTSRFENVCTQMGVRKTDSIFRVGVLNDAEARTLFFDSVEQNGDDPEFQKIGEDIVKKCGGLPIAIVTIARSLSGKIKEAWEAARSRLEHDNLKDLKRITQRIFEMSYENLQEDEDKSIFLLSGLFPDDFNIPTEELFMYGWGLNIFKNVKTLAIARRDMKICVDNLIHANLLTESDREGCVKMHDLVRAFVLSNFSKVKQASIVNHDNMLPEDANESYERILLKCTGMFPAQFNYPNLSLLILMDGDKRLKFPDNFNERMKKLEVLSYQSMHTPLLGVTFKHTTKLRTLCLHSCLLGDDISFIGSLSNLETLSFADCGIRKLPSTIGKLKKLKLLDLSGCADLCIDDGVFQCLDSLEELYMRASSGKAIRFTDSNCKELEILSNRLFALELEFFKNKAQPKNVSFEKLKRFMISIGCELSCSENYSFRNTLKLVADCNELLECKINVLFKETEELELQVKDMNCLDDVSMHQSFCNLRVLTVSNCADMTYLFTVPVASGLKKLVRLTITDCPVLKELVGENSGGELIKFQELKFMYLEGLPCITCIYPDNNNASPKQPFLNKEVAIPKLEELGIIMMKNLMQIWPCEITTSEKTNVPMLKKIRVSKCDSLVNLFPSNPLPLLSHLEELEVAYCGSIEVLFNIDLERGYDEMEQESSRLRHIHVYQLGKLRELWRMKGVNNSDILINGFKAVKAIHIIKCERFTNIFTPTTTNFDLGALTEYVSVNTGQDLEERESKNKWVERSKEINVKSKGVGCRCFPLPAPQKNVILKGDTSEMDDNIPNVTYISHILHTCHHHLQHLWLEDDPRVEVVFEMLDSPSSRELATIGADRQKSLLLPYLKVLDLIELQEMSHVWKCNWNEFLIPQQPPLEFPFQNLTTIHLSDCRKIKYLFSPLMAKFLSNLNYLSIWSCEGIEEVVSSRDDENETCTSSHTNNNTFFPHLDQVRLGRLPRLKRIDGGDQFQGAQVIAASWSLCQYPRNIEVEGCNALSGSLIPWYAVGQMKKLEELEISNCVKITEVFESEMINSNSSNVNVDEGSAVSGGTSGASTLISPGPKNITLINVPQLSNLKAVSIHDCNLLRHVFTFSTLESLKQLNKLKVVGCKEIRVIVKEENGTTASSSSKDAVVFPRLETLELVNLPNLEGFFLGGMNDFRWPLLDHVIIKNCPRMKVFTTRHSTAPKLKYIHTSLGKHSLESGLNFHVTTANHHDQTTFPSLDPTVSKGLPWSFHNLIEIDMKYTDVETIIPSNALLQLQKLEKIYLGDMNFSDMKSVEEVFDVVASEGKNNSGFNESQTVVNIPNLRQVELKRLDKLKYLWKNNPWMTLEFPNLTTVSIQRCKRVEHLFTCSMVGSLRQLQDLHISECKNIEVIVKEEECDAKVNHEIIMLPRLTSLTLERLPSLKGFCLGKETFSLPSLDTLEIKECPAIMVFTVGRLDTPKLKVIDTTFGMCYAREDLNSFIKTKQQEGLEF